jgi:hypothetical protein
MMYSRHIAFVECALATSETVPLFILFKIIKLKNISQNDTTKSAVIKTTKSHYDSQEQHWMPACDSTPQAEKSGGFLSKNLKPTSAGPITHS